MGLNLVGSDQSIWLGEIRQHDSKSQILVNLTYGPVPQSHQNTTDFGKTIWRVLNFGRVPPEEFGSQFGKKGSAFCRSKFNLFSQIIIFISIWMEQLDRVSVKMHTHG
jgi:hypothetical protein